MIIECGHVDYLMHKYTHLHQSKSRITVAMLIQSVTANIVQEVTWSVAKISCTLESSPDLSNLTKTSWYHGIHQMVPSKAS